jgi:hypothetical protein
MTTSARIGAHRTWPFAALAIATVFAVAACGNASPSTSASQPASAAPSAAAPSVASVAPSVPASVAPTAPASVQPSSGTGSASDPAKDVKIAAPYTIAPLPAALQSVFEQQMQASLGALGNNITFGFRTIAGGAGQNILMVMAFPSGTLSASAFTGMVGGMGASMNANLTKTTTDGVDIFAGASPTGGVAIFHVGDHAIIVISEKSDDALKVAQALVGANH